MEEKAQYIIEPTKNISEEVAAIFSLIKEYRQKRNNELDKSKAGGLGRAAKIMTAFSLLVIAAVWITIKTQPVSIWGNSEEGIRIALQLIVLFIYFLGGLTFLLQYISLSKFFSNATDELIGLTEQVVLDDVELFSNLDALSTQSIDYVAKRLDRIANQVGSIRSFLLGAIEKVGIIPGLLATLIAMSQIAQDADQPWIELLSFVLLGVYIAMFPLATSAFRIRNVTFVLNHYLKQFRSEGREHND